jgi:hypothetical protein
MSDNQADTTGTTIRLLAVARCLCVPRVAAETRSLVEWES